MSVKADPTKVSLLDLHGEIRNRIYGELLPSTADFHVRQHLLASTTLRGQGPISDTVEFLRTAHAFRPSSQDKPGSSTAFMASCRQIHEEAASLLYAKKEFVINVNKNGVLGWKEPIAAGHKLLTRNLSALNQASILTVEVGVALDEPYGVCHVQHALFELLAHFRPGHMLQRLNFEINTRLIQGMGHRPEKYVVKECDGHLVRRFIREYGMDLESLQKEDEEEAGEDARMYSGKELDRISPGDVSEHHLVAFLTEPLRTIRNLGDAIDKGVLRVEFNGYTRRPLGEIPAQVSDLMQSDAPVLHYHIFRSYYAQLSYLIRFGQCMLDRFAQETMGALDKLAAQRIRGDVPAFRLAHRALLDHVATMLPSACGPLDRSNEYFTRVCRNAVYKQRSDVEWMEFFEQGEREMEFCMLELERCLPPEDTDVSFFGCRQVDDKIREHHLHKKAKIRKAALELLEQQQGRAGSSRRMSV